MNNIKPRIVVSACLGLEKCRYNGNIEKSQIVNKLKSHADLIPVCPELGIGLPTPRVPLRIVRLNGITKLIQHDTQHNYYKSMIEFSNNFLDSLNEIDGFIMKSRSPSCGTKDVKIYSSMEKGASFNKGKGIFAELVYEKFPNQAIDDEGRLNNYNIREYFYSKLFARAKFREVVSVNDINELKKFHENNILLFTMYNKKRTNELNKLMNSKNKFDYIIKEYNNCLGMIFARQPRASSKTNILYEVIDQYITNKREEQYILDSINKYKGNIVPYSVPLNLVHASLYRENNKLANQSLFSPYPEELVEVTDSGKGRDLGENRKIDNP